MQAKLTAPSFVIYQVSTYKVNLRLHASRKMMRIDWYRSFAGKWTACSNLRHRESY